MARLGDSAIWEFVDPFTFCRQLHLLLLSNVLALAWKPYVRVSRHLLDPEHNTVTLEAMIVSRNEAAWANLVTV